MSSHLRPLIERAFELAASGDHTTITEIRMALRREGYESVEPQLTGPVMRKQLRRLLDDARAARPDEA